MPRLQKPLTSSAWNYFEKLNKNEVQCKLCQVTLAFHRSTTAMHSHLRAKHPAEGGGRLPISTRQSKFDDRRAKETTVSVLHMIESEIGFHVVMFGTRNLSDIGFRFE